MHVYAWNLACRNETVTLVIFFSEVGIIRHTSIGEDLDRGLGDEVGALAPNIFLTPLQKCDIWGGDGGDSLCS